MLPLLLGSVAPSHPVGLRQRSDLAKDVGGDLARDAREVAEDERGCDRVVERAVGGVGNDRRVGGEALQGIARRRREQDRRELGGVEALGAGRHPCAFQERDIETHVVADEARRTVAESEGHEESDGLLGRGRVAQILVANAGQAQDRRRERPARIREGEESLPERHRAVGRHGQADRADLDDRLGLRLVPCGLEVDCDEDSVQGSPI